MELSSVAKAMNEDLQVTPNLATDTWVEKIEGVDWRRKWGKIETLFGEKNNGRFELVLDSKSPRSIWGVNCLGYVEI